MDEQNVALLYAFCYCFNYLTKEWMASLADGKTVAGVFADNKAFLVREDAKYLAEYDPASQKGMIVFFPEVIPGKGHKSTFWDVGGVYHKYYLMMDVPSVIKKGFKSKLMTIMLKGFSAVAQDWKPTVEKNVEKMLIDGKKYLAETDSKTVGSNLSKKMGTAMQNSVRSCPPQIDVSKEDWLVNRRGIEALDDDLFFLHLFP